MLKRIFTGNLVVIAMMMLFQVADTKAAWGDYDTSFGFQGAVTDAITGYVPNSVAIQPDGKILVTGYRNTILGTTDFFLRRYLANGQLDPSFGKNGAAVVTNPVLRGSYREGKRIAVFANGKIAVVGLAGTNDANNRQGSFAVWQFTSTGQKESTFGDGGLQILTRYTFSSDSSCEINIQSGKLLLSVPTSSQTRLALIRLTATGAADSTFGTTGESLTNLRGYSFGTLVDAANGKITVGGHSVDSPFYTALLERKTANGQTDSTFAPTPAPLSGDSLDGLVKLETGKFAIRKSYPAVAYFLSLIIFGSNGTYESTVPISSGNNGGGCPFIFATQNNGKVLVTETTRIFRLDPDLNTGTMETYNCANISGATWTARPAIQGDDKMVIAGTYNNYLVLARLLPD